jgi:NTE family protein
MSDPTRVAIACQGGGSHTAFTAGVLKALLPRMDGEYDLVGMSGTSGGAVSAVAAWDGLCTENPEGAGERLDAVWSAIAASSPSERLTNDWVQRWEALRNMGAPVPEVSPYHTPIGRWGQERLREVIESELRLSACRAAMDDGTPRLVVGAVDVNAGRFETFVNEAITADAILASASVPTIFPAVEIDGHHYWDGLFSQNPPIHDLTHLPPDRKPEELWVVQINPQSRERVPRSVEEIADRRNELSGNLSMNQELAFVEQVNRWIDAGYLPEDRFERIAVRRIGIHRNLSYPSKLDRDPTFVEELMTAGERVGNEFLDGLRGA